MSCVVTAGMTTHSVAIVILPRRIIRDRVLTRTLYVGGTVRVLLTGATSTYVNNNTAQIKKAFSAPQNRETLQLYMIDCG